MSDAPSAAPSRRTYAVFAIVERDHRPNLWIRVGSAFPNRDGSTNLVLDAFPIGTNRLQIREQRPDEEARPAQNGAQPRLEEVRP